MSISRRTFLKGLGASTLGFGLLKLPQRVSYAQTATSDAEVAAFYRFKLGDFDMIAISDGGVQLPAALLAGNGTPEDVQAAYEQLSLPLNPDGTINATVLNLLLLDGDRVALFDTGNGVGVGKLVPTLNALGIAPENVTDVIMSHFHPDHINGLSTEGALTFPNAMVHFPQVEYDFMQSAPADAVGGALEKLQPALDAEQVSFYAADAEVTGGVQAVATPGHTPGHAAFLINSGDSQLLHVVDAAVSAYTSLLYPEWHFAFDADPNLAVETRKALLSRASDERLQIFGYHYPFPGLGYAVRQGEADSWMWVPAAF